MGLENVSLSELARRNGIAETTARRYINQFSEYFNPSKEGQRVLYPAGDGEVLLQIAKLYAQTLTPTQVKDKLSQEFNITITPESPGANLIPMDSSREIASRERLAKALEALADQKAAIERIDERSRQLEEKEKRRDKEIRDLHSRLKMLESQSTELKQLPWWKKLFQK